jgi:hypothetical protein
VFSLTEAAMKPGPKSTRWLVLIGFLACAGCGVRTAEFSGRVTYKGKPVYRGSITLEGNDKKALVAAIGDDGTFQFPSLPVGTYKIAVLCPEPSADAPAPGPNPADKRLDTPGGAIDPNSAKRWFKIPTRSGDPEQSGLRVEVSAPATTKEIELID